MLTLTKEQLHSLTADLTINCSHCTGLCCVALYFAKIDGFPQDKPTGKPCKNLCEDFTCSIHSMLQKKNMKGCLSYDCFGAGQKVSQLFQEYTNWKNNPKQAAEIFDTFGAVFRLHQVLWYLVQAYTYVKEDFLKNTIAQLILENQAVTSSTPTEILNFDLDGYRQRANLTLKTACESLCYKRASTTSKLYLGKNFKQENLKGQDFSMAMLIAANLEGCNLHSVNFLGADLRDANVKNTDLSSCYFLTQMQMNSARGNQNTRLPFPLTRPRTWK